MMFQYHDIMSCGPCHCRVLPVIRVIVMATDGLWDVLHPTVVCEVALEVMGTRKSRV